MCSSCGLVAAAGAVERAPYLPNATLVEAGAPAPKRWRGTFRNSGERQIREMCESAGLASVRPIACAIWNSARESPSYKARKGANARGYLVAIIFHACKMAGVPRTPKELCSLLGADLSSMRRMVKETQTASDSAAGGREYSFSAPDPVSIIHRYLYKMDLDDKDRGLLKECASELWARYGSRLDTYERDSIIAGMLFFMYGGNRDYIDKIAETCRVCNNTVKGVFAKIAEWEMARTEPRGSAAPDADPDAAAGSAAGARLI